MPLCSRSIPRVFASSPPKGEFDCYLSPDPAALGIRVERNCGAVEKLGQTRFRANQGRTAPLTVGSRQSLRKAGNFIVSAAAMPQSVRLETAACG